MTAGSTSLAGQAGGSRKGLSVPKIRLLSPAGGESVGWGFIIAHLVKWAVSFGYFATWQVRYAVGYGPTTFTVVYWKDFWDRLPVHVQNGAPGELAVAAGIPAAVLAWGMARRVFRPERRLVKALLVLVPLLIGVAVSLTAAQHLAGWHVHWFPGQDEPAWWVTWRHDIRDVGISLIGTVIVKLMFTKPKYGADDHPGVRVYLTRVPLAIGAALVPIAAVGTLAWKLPWLMQHGWHVPSQYGPLAAEANGWISAGTWITVLMGIAGGLVAGKVIQRIADDIQWFFAERSAGKLRAEGFLSTGRVIGTPAHRLRVHWLLDNSPDLEARSPWLVRALVAVAVVSVLFAGAGAWLNLAGPAAH